MYPLSCTLCHVPSVMCPLWYTLCDVSNDLYLIPSSARSWQTLNLKHPGSVVVSVGISLPFLLFRKGERFSLLSWKSAVGSFIAVHLVWGKTCTNLFSEAARLEAHPPLHFSPLCHSWEGLTAMKGKKNYSIYLTEFLDLCSETKDTMSWIFPLSCIFLQQIFLPTREHKENSRNPENNNGFFHYNVL